ncbi:MAG TPA: ABC transporter permease [Mycobacterium sp.]|nr:ABC transporter permease [Mycobacterium sp.]
MSIRADGSLLTHSWVQAARLLMRWRRDPAVMIGSILLPICLMLIYQVVLGEQVRKVTGVESVYSLVPLCAVLSALFGALGDSVGIQVDRQTRMISRMWVMPVHRASVPIGFLIAEAVRALFGTTLITAIGVAFGLRFTHGWPTVLIYVLIPSILVIGYSALILALATRTNGRGFMSWLVGVTISLAFVNPGTTPIGLFPGWLQPLVRVQPMSPPIETMWALAHGGPLRWPVLLTLLWAAVQLAVFLPIAMRGYRRVAESGV